jgi:hypothetical protein
MLRDETGFKLPSIADIQRTSLILVAATGVALLLRSPAGSLSCAIGGALVIGNLFILSLLGRLLLAGASGGASSALGAIAIPFKLLLIVTLVYLVFTQSRIDPIGFALGVTAQLVAVGVETARASRRAIAS